MSGLPAPGHHRHPDEVLLGFARALRAAGVALTHDRAASFLEAASLVHLGEEAAVRTAGRATLCSNPDDLGRFDQVFEAFFDHRSGLPRPRPAVPGALVESTLPETDEELAGEAETGEAVRVRASAEEVLRHRDVATLSPAEKARLAGLVAGLRVRPPLRRTARHRRWHRGEVDARATVRASLRQLGEPAPVTHRRRATTARRVVLLVDVSGSMSGYADALLRVAHRLSHGPGARVETFTVGTRLTHLTRALSTRDPERALVAVGEAVPDWSGGTRLGEALQVFLDRWGRRGMARGAVVVVLSDGWERGDTVLLAEQMARLHRLAHRVVWVNPHRGKDGYEPVQSGVRAVLPHVDDFLAGHSLATYAHLCEVIARA